MNIKMFEMYIEAMDTYQGALKIYLEELKNDNPLVKNIGEKHIKNILLEQKNLINDLLKELES